MLTELDPQATPEALFSNGMPDSKCGCGGGCYCSYIPLSEAATMLSAMNERLSNARDEGLSMDMAREVRDGVAVHLDALGLKTNPIASIQTFEMFPVEATTVSAESIEHIVTATIETMVASIKVIWESLRAFIARLMLLVKHVHNKARVNKSDIAEAVDKPISDIPENYIRITKEYGAFYRADTNDFTDNLVSDMNDLNGFLMKGFKPYLQDEIETAKALLEIYRPLTRSTIDYESDEIEKYSNQIVKIYDKHDRHLVKLYAPFEGFYLGGLEVKASNDTYVTAIAKPKMDAKEFTYLALTRTSLNTLNEIAGSILSIANNELHALYKDFEVSSQRGVDSIKDVVDVYRKSHKFSVTKSKRVDNLIAKHFNHFRKTSGTISNTINVFVRASYVTVNDFIPKNLAILNVSQT